jgi:flavin reductase (DIM6/NTAB) family NADH-FMN oxidoreductase RutF
MTTQREQVQQESIDARVLRSVCGLYVTGVTVITTGDELNAAGTTVNSFTSVSLDPPLILFCLHKESRLRDVLKESGMFVVNLLAEQQEPVSRAFARRDTAEFATVEHHRSVGGVPILSEAMAFLECRQAGEIDGGDHVIVLGEVIDLGVLDPDPSPLVFFRGLLGALESRA